MRSGRCVLRPGRTVLVRLSVALVSLSPLGGVPAEDGHQSARGWLTLERDQRDFRERTGPVSLPESRRLDAMERGQEVDQRVVDQGIQRSKQQERVRARTTSRPVVPPSQRSTLRSGQGQRQLERQRQRVERQQRSFR